MSMSEIWDAAYAQECKLHSARLEAEAGDPSISMTFELQDVTRPEGRSAGVLPVVICRDVQAQVQAHFAKLAWQQKDTLGEHNLRVRVQTETPKSAGGALKRKGQQQQGSKGTQSKSDSLIAAGAKLEIVRTGAGTCSFHLLGKGRG